MENDFNYHGDDNLDYQNDNLKYQYSNEQAGYGETAEETASEVKEQIRQEKLKEYKAEKEAKINHKLIESQHLINQTVSDINHRNTTKLVIYGITAIIVTWIGLNVIESLLSIINTNISTTTTNSASTINLNPFREGFSLNPRNNEAFKNTIKLFGTFIGLMITITIISNKTKKSE